jgi:hypothetical protein
MDIIGTRRTIGMHSPTITREYMTPEERDPGRSDFEPAGVARR